MLKAALFVPALSALPKPPRLAPVQEPVVFSDDFHGLDSDALQPVTREWSFIAISHTPAATWHMQYAGGQEFRGRTDDKGRFVCWEEVLPSQAG